MTAPRTLATRALDARKIDYEVFTFPPDVHSAVGVAEAIGQPRDAVYKTLVALPPDGRPLLVMIAGERELDLKRVARAVGVKKVRMAPHREAESLTGLQTGGISALALIGRPFDVYLDRQAAEQSHIVVSAGQRGVNLRLAVDDLIRVTGARTIEATRP